MSIIAPLPIEVRAEYKFNEDEKRQLGADLAAKIDRREGLESEKKSMMSDFKDRLDRASSEIKKLSSNLNLGYEFRSYTCKVEKNYKLKIKEYYCVHTGKLIDTRKFDPQDFQQTFADEAAAKKNSTIPQNATEYRDGKYFDKKGKEIKVSVVEDGEPKPTLKKPLDIKDPEQVKKENAKKLEKEGTEILKKSGIKKNGQPSKAKK